MSFRIPAGVCVYAPTAAILAVLCLAIGPAPARAGSHGADADLQPDQLQPCVNVPNCRRNATPYIWIPALQSNSWRLDCGGREPYNWATDREERRSLPTTGYDYSDSSKWVARALTFDHQVGTPDSPGYFVERATNYDTQGHHWDYAIGCSPMPPKPGAERQSDPRPATVTVETVLAPERLTTVRRSCRSGARVVEAAHGVGWLRRSRNPGREVQVAQTRTSGTVTWHFLTGNVRPGNVRAQTHLTCSRR